MPAKLTLLGIDGMDYEIVKSLFEQLPNISRVSKEGFLRRLDSVFPPDSDTAWATIFTGLNPSEHGVVKFVDPLEKSISYLTEEAPSSVIRGRCVWDKLSSKGARVCVVLPHAAFPPWPVNGVMLSRSSFTNEVRVTPEGVVSRSELEGLKAPRGFPGRSEKSLKRYLRASRRLFDNTSRLALRLHDQEEWDFFFMYSPILDIVPHFFWKFYDRDDPAYPGPNAFEDVIPQLYSEHDALAGQFFDRLRKGDLMTLMSDHGHGRRPTYEYKMNETLRREGLLSVNETRSANDRNPRGFELTSKATELLQWLSLENVASSLMRHFPQLRSRIVNPSWIDWQKTKAAMVDLSGLKSYCYGGLRINRESIQTLEEYEVLRERIIRIVEEIEDPRNGTKIALWVKRREDFYQGSFTNEFPDVVYQLRSEYGFNPKLGTQLLEASRYRTIVPGTHIGSNAVLTASGPPGAIETFRDCTVYSFAARIVEYLSEEPATREASNSIEGTLAPREKSLDQR